MKVPIKNESRTNFACRYKIKISYFVNLKRRATKRSFPCFHLELDPSAPLHGRECIKGACRLRWLKSWKCSQFIQKLYCLIRVLWKMTKWWWKNC